MNENIFTVLRFVVFGREWNEGATGGIVLAGGRGEDETANQFKGPIGLSFDLHSHL